MFSYPAIHFKDLKENNLSEDAGDDGNHRKV